MTDEPTDDGDGPEGQEPETNDESHGFHLKVGIRPISDLLGNLIEVNVGDSPPPPTDFKEWTDVDEKDQQRESDKSSRERIKRGQRIKSHEFHLDTRFDNDEFVVTADIPGANKDDLSIGINPTTNVLVISKDRTIFERVDLPWDSPEPTKVWFNNGVLEVRLRSADANYNS